MAQAVTGSRSTSRQTGVDANSRRNNSSSTSEKRRVRVSEALVHAAGPDALVEGGSRRESAVVTGAGQVVGRAQR